MRSKFWFTALMLALLLNGELAGAQGSEAIVRKRLTSQVPLTSDEIAQMLKVSRELSAGKMFNASAFTNGPTGVEFLMGKDGNPILLRTRYGIPNSSGGTVNIVNILHYTQQPARNCKGTAATSGELVIDYKNNGDGWTATARRKMDLELLSPMFKAIRGELSFKEIGQEMLEGRLARGLRAPWNPEASQSVIPLAPAVADTMQTLWIDEQTLLPLRWSVTMTHPKIASPIDYGPYLTLDNSIDLRVPDIQAPTCIGG